MTSYDRILEQALGLVKPSSGEITRAGIAVKQVVRQLNKSLQPLKADAVLSGSARKGTQLKNTGEADIFVRFDYSKYADRHTNLSNILEKRLKRIFPKVTRLHGSRDYFSVRQKPYTFEIVPVLKIASAGKAKNITDVSPLHARWVARCGKGKQDQIRLLKAFLAARHLYGAESYIRGFSGYACEVLTLHYGSFISVLQAAKTWEAKQVIDPVQAYRSKDPLFELNKSKIAGPLVIIDPVQPSRNVTAAVTNKAFDAFRKTAQQFLKRPSLKYFIKTFHTVDSIRKQQPRNSRLLILSLTPRQNKPDVMGAASLRIYERFRRLFEQHNFKLRKSDWQFDGRKALVWFYLSRKNPPLYEVRIGPCISQKKHAKRFLARHKKVTLRNKRYAARVKRPFSTPRDLVQHALRDKSLTQKMSGIGALWA